MKEKCVLIIKKWYPTTSWSLIEKHYGLLLIASNGYDAIVILLIHWIVPILRMSLPTGLLQG